MDAPQITHIARTITLPGHAESIVNARVKALSERLPGITFSAYANSLIAFDCWAEKPHEFSGAACIDGGTREDWLWKDIAEDFGQTKDREWFAKRLPEILQARAAREKSGEQVPIFTRKKFTVRTPELAENVIQARLATLGMEFPQYVASLIAYDCWCERSHSITGPSCVGSRGQEFILWAEIVRDFGKPDKTRGWFDVRLDEIRRGISVTEEPGNNPLS